jgi:hypothetical protein
MELGSRFVRELTARFAEIQSQFNLINSIDRAIVTDDRSIEDTISNILKLSLENFQADAASAYVVTEAQALPFPPDGTVRPVETNESLLKRISNCQSVDVFDANGSAYLLLPILVTSIKLLRIVFVFEAPCDNDNWSKFSDEDLRAFAEMVASQSGILISKKLEAHWHESHDDIEDAYFSGVTKNDAFSLERRWFDLTTYFRNFLPSWSPLRIEPRPEIQILTWDGNAETILLRAGTDREGPSIAKALFISETICGLIIEEEISRKVAPPPLLVDPTHSDFERRYKAYLLNKIPRTELVIPIRWARTDEEEKTIALVNLEHPNPDAFSKIHIEILSKATELIAPYVAALIYEESQQRARDVAHIYMLHGILAKMATTYRHKVGQRLIAASLSLEALEGLGQRLEGNERKFFDRLNRSVVSFSELSRSFVSDLPNYVRFANTPLLPLVNAALNEFDPPEMKRADEISMVLRVEQPDFEPHVFGSPLIREHIYNILHNCIFAVREKLKEGLIKEGLIAITVLKESQTDRLKEKDSFPLIVVQIEDNGGGLSAQAAQRYGEFGNTHGKANGSGYGVAAAREYLLTIGGAFEWSHYTAPDGTRGLRQRLCFPEYVDAIHRPMSSKFYFFGQANAEG